MQKAKREGKWKAWRTGRNWLEPAGSGMIQLAVPPPGPRRPAAVCRLLPSAGRAGSMLSGTKRRPPRVVAGGAREQEEEFREVLEEEVVEGREREREEEEEAKESLLPSSYLFFSFLFATQLTEPIPTPKPAKGKGQTPS